MLSQKLLYRFANIRINNEIKEKETKELSSIYYCEYCYKEYMTSMTLFKHKQKCKEKDTFINKQYNCICTNRKYIYQESRIEHEKICNDDVISELIIEEDWLKLLSYYDNAYIKDLKNQYKEAFNNVKHLRNKSFLILLNKISNESDRFRKYLSDRTIEYPPAYWSNLSLEDFEILN